ncbi:MAG: serine/threonine protein kinase [Gammaproteobacteria bacterium]|nr:serine/threonine protein kinase [Gammaproteobacteria bacterium]
MLKFQQAPKEYNSVFLDDTDKALPEVLNPHTRYMFMSTIATGGKSLIKACKDRHLNRIVAYKTLRKEFLNDEIENKRFLREARVSAMLQHPSTIPIYEIGRDNQGHYYFTMKLVHGYTLREIMDYRERYDLFQLIDVIIQISQALAAAHNSGVAHRDIKPENILVGSFSEVLLLDWGLAKVWSKDGSVLSDDGHQSKLVENLDKSMTGFGKLQGTICYMSPEQIRRDQDISFSSDIYSLGAVLYELLAGVPPFNSEKVYELLAMIENDAPELPSKITKLHVPKVLEKLCLKCLQKDPQLRPSIKEVIQTLQQDWI